MVDKKLVKKAALSPRRLSINRVLDIIDVTLARGDANARDLWAVLSALRGPDDESSSKKEKTTIHIRRQAFPRVAKLGVANVGASFSTSYQFSCNTSWSHFNSHIRSAYTALHRVNRWKEPTK